MSSGELPEPVLLPSAGEPLPVLLMNTVWADRAGVHDLLGTEGGLDTWLAAVGSLGNDLPTPAGRVGAPEAERFRRLRDALRTLAAVSTGDTRGPAVDATPAMTAHEAATVLNAAAAAAPPVPALQLPAWVARPAPPARPDAGLAAVSRTAALGVELFGGPDRGLVRACYAPGCVLYFVKDHPRREWCSAACGNRARAARHYQRHRQGRRHGEGPGP